jgi:gamma-glutamylcyclotransferase (GGCT)/AIG2-like uncharacterized protein YtfP
MANIFTYGTLEIPAVMAMVAGKSFPSFPATANGFARFLLKDRIYPGMIAAPGEHTAGYIYVDLDQETLGLLDQFEDDLYIRQIITVTTTLGSTMDAYAYITPTNQRACLSPNPWDRHYFERHHLQPYLEGCKEFHAQAVLANLKTQA